MTGADSGSFRDPSGFVFTRGGTLYRQVNREYGPAYDHLIASGLCDALVQRGLLVAHEEVDPGLAARPGAHRVLRPERVPFVSYPYEWCFSQLRAAAEATLEAQQLALDHGMTLKDASAYNVAFRGWRPVLIDTLSFDVLAEASPWVAYRQFCEHFLAPLALMATVDVRLGQLSRVYLDGVPLDLAAALLPAATRLRPGLALHVHQHARSQRRHAGESAHDAGKSPRAVSLTALKGLADNLRSTICRLDWRPRRSDWLDYYEGDSYSQRALAGKREAVERWLTKIRPRMVFDLGANTGMFSRLATRAGATTISFELDPASVETNYRQARADDDADLLPLVLDLTNPSPAQGWAHAERRSLAQRGPADLVLALALVHHLAIGNNVPLPMVAAFLRQLGSWAVVEFVPKQDPKTQILLRSRADVFAGYTEPAFESAVREHFSIVAREPVEGSHRSLYLLEAR